MARSTSSSAVAAATESLGRSGEDATSGGPLDSLSATAAARGSGGSAATTVATASTATSAALGPRVGGSFDPGEVVEVEVVAALVVVVVAGALVVEVVAALVVVVVAGAGALVVEVVAALVVVVVDGAFVVVVGGGAVVVVAEAGRVVDVGAVVAGGTGVVVAGAVKGSQLAVASASTTAAVMMLALRLFTVLAPTGPRCLTSAVYRPGASAERARGECEANNRRTAPSPDRSGTASPRSARATGRVDRPVTFRGVP